MSTVAQTPVGSVAAVVDGGELDCGSGLLLLITRAIRRLDAGQHLAVRSAQSSVATDLPVWADLTGHELTGRFTESADGPWWFAVRKAPSSTSSRNLFSGGAPTPVGRRLWAYTNFDCNLACSYCCAESSPGTPARRLSPAVARQAFAEFAALGGRELFLTGGEPFLHPELAAIVEAAGDLERTILTNAMVFGRGARLQALEGLDRSVVLQVSLDSASPELHDAQRGPRSWARAVAGIARARALGFRVRVAATLYEEDPVAVAALHRRLDDEGIPAQDRVIRPVAREGFAAAGVHVSIDTLEPEPTITADGAWWHPVAVADPALRIHDAPLPISEILGVVRDTVAVQDAAARSGRTVFRCA